MTLLKYITIHPIINIELQYIRNMDKYILKLQLHQQTERETTAVGRSSYYFWGFAFGADSISEKVVGFSPLWFPLGKTLCSC